MKIRKIGDTPKAVRIFTDREEPRAAFWAMYEKASEQMGSDDADVHVISYYGIGGIGKSRLLKQLRVEMDEKIAKPYYAEIDFETGRECREALEHLKNKLAERYKFSFPMFELCSYAYSQKIGENPESPKVKGFIEKSPLLKTVFTAGGFVPGLDVVTSVLTAADETVAAFRGSIQKNKTELLKLREMSAEDIYKQLPVYFAKDMLNNMQKLTSPLVVFVDTYERLVNELEQIGDPLKNDVWLRGENGVIQNIPGVLWVIAGREKLKWQKFDADWEQALEQHMLGNLSFADSSGFLSEAGITDAALQKYIYKLTDGTPVYLDLCVDQYEALLEKGITPEEELFGENTEELVERFIRYMNDTQKDMVYMLVCMGRWKDSIISAKGAQILPGFSLSTYEKTKELSVVVALDSGECAFHQTVGEVLFKNMPDIIRKTIGEKLIEIHKETLESHDFFGDGYADALFYTARGGMALYRDKGELEEFYNKYLNARLFGLSYSGETANAKNIADELVSYASENNKDMLYAKVLISKAEVFGNEGKWENAQKALETVKELYKKSLGESHKDTIEVMRKLTKVLEKRGEEKEVFSLQQEITAKTKEPTRADDDEKPITTDIPADENSKTDVQEKIKIATDVLKKRIEMFGENHPVTIGAMDELAGLLAEIGDYETAFDLQKKVGEKSAVVLGEEHPDTLRAMNNLAIISGQLGRYAEAYAIQRKALEISRNIMGENHPQTLTMMGNMADLLSCFGNYTEVYKIRKEILRISKNVFGEDHTSTLTAMNNLAVSLMRTEEYEKAYRLLKENIEKSKYVLGEKHKHTLGVVQNIVCVLIELKQYDEAIEYGVELLERRKNVFGEKHPDNLIAIELLTEALERGGYYDEETELLRELLVLQQTVLGENHPDTIRTAQRISANEEFDDMIDEIVTTCNTSHTKKKKKRK